MRSLYKLNVLLGCLLCGFNNYLSLYFYTVAFYSKGNKFILYKKYLRLKCNHLEDHFIMTIITAHRSDKKIIETEKYPQTAEDFLVIIIINLLLWVVHHGVSAISNNFHDPGWHGKSVTIDR